MYLKLKIFYDKLMLILIYFVKGCTYLNIFIVYLYARKELQLLFFSFLNRSENNIYFKWTMVLNVINKNQKKGLKYKF